MVKAAQVLESSAAEQSNEQISDFDVSQAQVLLSLAGPGGQHLPAMSRELAVSIGQRGNTLRLRGTSANVTRARRVLGELVRMIHQQEMNEGDLLHAVRTLCQNPDLQINELTDDVIIRTISQRLIAPKSPNQKRYVDAIRNNDIVFGVGPAGTGKTYLAMAMAVRALQEQRVQRIILTRPAVEAGERLGFLPGDLAEKINPYLRPLYDALNDMMAADKVLRLLERGTIEVAPLAFMRGRTLNDSFVVLDEAQNTTPEQMKMFLTRLGFNSQAVITGDITQIDLPEGKRSGLHDAIAVLGKVDGLEFTYFNDVDVVRHPLVQRIIRAYESRD